MGSSAPTGTTNHTPPFNSTLSDLLHHNASYLHYTSPGKPWSYANGRAAFDKAWSQNNATRDTIAKGRRPHPDIVTLFDFWYHERDRTCVTRLRP